VHCHLIFHLPTEYRTGAKLEEIKAAIERLVDRHGDGILGEFAVKLTLWPDPDGLYLLKGGGPRCGGCFRASEGMAQGARHHLRQAVRHLAEPQSSSSAASL
jgi:hypothetical protein